MTPLRADPHRTCLVTGASSGIGAAIATELARRGMGITLVARRQQRLEELADELRTLHGVRADIIVADLIDPSSRAHIAVELSRRELEVDVLVNNAGTSTFGPVHHSDPDREMAMVRTNVEAVVDLCSRFVPEMVRRGHGAVLNVASTAAYQPLPGQAGYAASKAFVLSYTRALRAETRGTGITATALCPGPVATEFGADAAFDGDEVLPRFMWRSVEAVAQAAVEGLARDRAVVIPGVPNKLTALGGHLTPRGVLLPLLARQHPAL